MFTFAIYGTPDSRVAVYADTEADAFTKALSVLSDAPKLNLIEVVEVDTAPVKVDAPDDFVAHLWQLVDGMRTHNPTVGG